jgi:hypothetical protein
VVFVLPPRGEVAGVPGYPMLQFRETARVLRGICGCLIELFIFGAVLQKRNLGVV